MKGRIQIILIILCCIMISLGSVSGAGVVSGTEAAANTPSHGLELHRDSQYSISSDSSLDLSNNLDYSAGEKYVTVPDVYDQFWNLQKHGDPMAFRLGVGENPTLYRHYQGMARVNDSSGKPYIIIVRSDNREDYADDPGELLVVEMGSRLNRDGERLRSNLLQHGKSIGDTVAPYEDRGVSRILFNGEGGWPAYSHLGGVQLVGDVLVVPLEWHCPTWYESGTGDCTVDLHQQGAIALLDVSNPISPQLIHNELLWYGNALGVVGATYVPQGQHPRTENGGRYLFIITWGGGHVVKFGWSNTDDLKTTTDIVLEDFRWVDDVFGDGWRNWQMLNFVRDINGTLYLFAADKDDAIPHDHWLGLFDFDLSRLNTSDYQGTITFLAQKKLKLNQPGMGSLSAASGIYVSPSGQLILYTGPHDNDAPKDEHGVGTVEMGEFRSINVYHEGTTARDTMCPWVELYEAIDGWNEHKRSIIIDFLDRHDDDWYALTEEGDWDDLTSALRTYLMPGQMLRLYEDVNYGGSIFERIGEGPIYVAPNLKDLGWNDMISSVKFFPFADPGGPYYGVVDRAISLNGANRCYGDVEAGVTYTWSLDSPPPPCTFSDPAARQPSLTCNDDDEFTIYLKVNEGSDESSTISTTVTVYAAQLFLPLAVKK